MSLAVTSNSDRQIELGSITAASGDYAAAHIPGYVGTYFLAATSEPTAKQTQAIQMLRSGLTKVFSDLSFEATKLGLRDIDQAALCTLASEIAIERLPDSKIIPLIAKTFECSAEQATEILGRTKQAIGLSSDTFLPLPETLKNYSVDLAGLSRTQKLQTEQFFDSLRSNQTLAKRLVSYMKKEFGTTALEPAESRDLLESLSRTFCFLHNNCKLESVSNVDLLSDLTLKLVLEKPNFCKLSSAFRQITPSDKLAVEFYQQASALNQEIEFSPAEFKFNLKFSRQDLKGKENRALRLALLNPDSQQDLWQQALEKLDGINLAREAQAFFENFIDAFATVSKSLAKVKTFREQDFAIQNKNTLAFTLNILSRDDYASIRLEDFKDFAEAFGLNDLQMSKLINKTLVMIGEQPVLKVQEADKSTEAELEVLTALPAVDTVTISAEKAEALSALEAARDLLSKAESAYKTAEDESFAKTFKSKSDPEAWTNFLKHQKKALVNEIELLRNNCATLEESYESIGLTDSEAFLKKEAQQCAKLDESISAESLEIAAILERPLPDYDPHGIQRSSAMNNRLSKLAQLDAIYTERLATAFDFTESVATTARTAKFTSFAEQIQNLRQQRANASEQATFAQLQQRLGEQEKIWRGETPQLIEAVEPATTANLAADLAPEIDLSFLKAKPKKPGFFSRIKQGASSLFGRFFGSAPDSQFQEEEVVPSA